MSGVGRIPVSRYTRGAVAIAGEYQGLTTVLAKAVAWLETAPAELATLKALVWFW